MEDNPIFVTEEELRKELERQIRECPLEAESLSESEEEDEDVEMHSDHDTDSTISVSDEEQENEDDSGEYYSSRNGNMRWNKEPLRVSSRSLKKDIVTHLPGVRPMFRDAESEMCALFHFLNDEVFELLVMYTNEYINAIKSKYKRPQDAKETDRDEMKALIGHLFLSGVYKSAHLNVRDLWGPDGPPVFGVTMSCERFLFLLKSIRFDSLIDRSERKKIDKLAPIRNLLDIIGKKFELAYSPSEYVTIDEQLIPFRGRCLLTVFAKQT